ncbi:MAG: PLP-dependent aminotransferase family protein [Winogradskyella sp.]|uniref:aminotransferase-like domain-containing protein n=1 Tax=Winogradskyella sp. TaxID=1883156 RepID=UPI0017E9A456|nr:PLP-dependent aminotransferase family protein [Winogradskyella sp.]
MNSPVDQLLQQLIKVDKTLVQPLYVQVAQQISNAIQRGYLSKGSKLPGTRGLSNLLHIHRNTAVAIYDELASQGWVEIIANKGTFVLEPERTKLKIKATTQHVDQAYSYPKQTGFPFQHSFHLASTIQNTKADIIINDGQPDLRLHPVYQFTRWYSAAMKRKPLISKWSRTSDLSSSHFKIQLSNYLNATRGFHIEPHNVLSTRSSEMSLYIVAQLLIKQDDVVLVGQLSRYTSNTIFQEAGAKIITIPTDNEGLNIDYIEKHFIKNSIRCVYVSANRDYPTTNTLSAERRLQLLQLAKTYGFAIIEDDYDYDFQYEGSGMLPMATADTNGMVIYLGKMGQSLFPSFQTGFVVAPKNLISEAHNYLNLLDEQGDLIQEQMLSELISEGEIYRLLKKNSVIYRTRRDAFCNDLKIYFKDLLIWNKPSGGLAVWIQFIKPVSLGKLAAEAEKLGLFLPKTILYQDRDTCGIRFGFGHLNETEIQTAVIKLRTAYDVIRDLA